MKNKTPKSSTMRPKGKEVTGQPENLDENLLYMALRWCSEIFVWRGMDYFLLGESAKTAEEGELKGSFLHLGMIDRSPRGDWSDGSFISGLEFLRGRSEIVDLKTSEKELNFGIRTSGGFPIPVKLELVKKLRCFEYPKYCWYRDIEGAIPIPNEPESYKHWLKERTLNVA